ncbi:MAG TPA: MBL fold metallo-hydrolase [Ktedonobacterales bacterium]|nr:MBL fold metallo-hydrolase [Ktedonobacterales bacterium]
MKDEGQQPGLTEVPNKGWDERLRLFKAGDEVDTSVLVTARYVVIIDTMATPELAQAILESVQPSLEGRQLLVINTHADYDHCWGNAIFAGPDAVYLAPIIAHEQARRRLQSDEARRYLAPRQQAGARFANVQLVAPTITFTDSLRIDGGDLTLELIPTPGHTSDHIAVWVPELSLLLAGDAAEHPFPYVEEAQTLPILRHSLERMAALNAATVIPCHGGTTDPALLTRNIAYFEAVEHHARSALASGLVPTDWHEREDIAEVVGLPYEQALEDVEADPAYNEDDMYRSFHRAAVRATLANLQADASVQAITQPG